MDLKEIKSNVHNTRYQSNSNFLNIFAGDV